MACSCSVNKPNATIMKPTIILFLAALLMLTSCIVYFEKPQPVHSKELKEVPKELIGTYVEEDNNNPLVITRNSYQYKEKNTGEEEMSFDNGMLETGKVILKRMDDFYVLSYKIGDLEQESLKSAWMVYLIKLKGDQLTVSYIASEDRNSWPKIDSVKRIVPVTEIKNNDNDRTYFINPSKKEFKSMIENKIFNDTLKFRKIK